MEQRIQAYLKRGSGVEVDHLQYDDGNLRIDLERGQVFRRGIRVRLLPAELRLLICLVHHQGRVISDAELLSLVWGENYPDAIESLSLYIRSLREKLEENLAEPDYIHTEWGKGYWFKPRPDFQV